MLRPPLRRAVLFVGTLVFALGAVGVDRPGPLAGGGMHLCMPAAGAATVGVTQFSHEGSKALVLGEVDLRGAENVDVLGARLIPVPGQSAIGTAYGWEPDPHWRSLGPIEPDGQEYHLVLGFEHRDPAQAASFDGVELTYTYGDRIQRDRLEFSVASPRAGQSCAAVSADG